MLSVHVNVRLVPGTDIEAIYGAVRLALATIAALIGAPGFRSFVDLLTQFYDFYGYSVSTFGVVGGGLFGVSSKASCISAYSP